MNPPAGPSGPQPSAKSRPWPNIWMITTFAILAIFALSMFVSNGGITGASIAMPQQQAADKAVVFINEQILGGQYTATLVNITEEKGLYLVTFDVDGQDYMTYVSRDGSLLFPQVVKMDETASLPSAANTEVPKTDVPVVQFFVMSFCPYGQQAEVGLKPVADLFGSNAVFEPHFIISVSGDTTQSLHDSAANNNAESAEDMRQAVILKHYDVATWWTYVDYFNSNCNINTVDACWKDAAKAASVDAAKVEEWAASEGLSLMAADAALTNQLGVTGSPTIFINGAPYNSNDRSPSAFQTAICGAFTTAPSECSHALSTTASAADSGACETP